MSAEAAHAHTEEAPHADPHHAAPAAAPHADPHHAAPAAAPHADPHHAPKPHAAKGAANDNVEHPTAKAPAAGARTQPPISKLFHKIKAGLTSSASSTVETTSKFGKFARKITRAGDLEPVSKVSLLKTPIYAAGHVLDGTALAAPRRIVEIAEPIAASALATVRTLGTVFHPINSISHPIQTLRKPARIVTSSILLQKQIAMAPFRLAHEIADRAIARTVEQVNTQISRVPIVGPIIATPTNWITRTVANAVGSVKNGVDWATSPIDHIHNWTSPDGHSAAPAANHAPAAHAKPAAAHKPAAAAAHH